MSVLNLTGVSNQYDFIMPQLQSLQPVKIVNVVQQEKHFGNYTIQ